MSTPTLHVSGQKEHDRMQQLDVVSPVDGLMDCCAGMAVVPKQEGSQNMCWLNQGWQVRKTSTSDNETDTQSASWSPHLYETRLWQIPLAEESKLDPHYIYHTQGMLLL